MVTKKVPVTVRVEDDRGGYDEQSFSIRQPDPGDGTISGRVISGSQIHADSLGDFSSTQGQDGWSYGYRTVPDPAGDEYDEGDFVEFSLFEPNGIWGRTWFEGPIIPQIWDSGAHANGVFGITGTTERILQEAIRRWTSDMDGDVQITGRFNTGLDTDLGGFQDHDGVGATLYVNGAEIWSDQLDNADVEGVDFSIPFRLNRGDIVDLVVDAGLLGNERDDSAQFGIVIHDPQLGVRDYSDFVASRSLTSRLSPVRNGDFESTPRLFESDLVETLAGQSIGEAEYATGSDPADHHPQFASFTDRSGDGVMMIVNGSTSPAHVVWRQDVEVLPNTEYNFEAWAASAFPSAPAQLQFRLNGETFEPLQLSPSVGEWTRLGGVWNSDDETELRLEIVNLTTAFSGNDFALDDIRLRANQGQTAVSDWTIYLDQNQNGRHDIGERFTTTDANGQYEFTNLPEATYYVREELQPGLGTKIPIRRSR